MNDANKNEKDVAKKQKAGEEGQKKKGLSTTQKIMLGFFVAIMAGTVLLSLPISVVGGETNILTALFTATTSVCVTGLVVVDTFSHWTLFGKVIILCLIQLGGLGIVAFTSTLMLLTRRKMTLKNRMTIQDAYGLNNLQGLVKFVKKVIAGTICVELFGMLCYLPVFIPRYGNARGIWYALFTAVSAFCNAGIDILGADSLMSFYSTPSVLITTMFLIFMGGIGFVVWWDVLDVLKQVVKKKIPLKDSFAKITLHSRLVLTVTAILILGGAFCILLLEYQNPETIGQMSLGDKILNSLFQSVTLRTAGFASVNQGGLTDSSTLLCIILMLIGGSPVGTAGGIKTVSVAVLFCTVLSVVKGQNEAVVFHKSINEALVKRALAVTFISIAVLFLFSILLMVTNGFGIVDALFETGSAVATVGLTRGITSDLNTAGRLLIVVAMYLGRIGPISMFVAFSNKYSIKNSIHYAEADILVG